MPTQTHQAPNATAPSNGGRGPLPPLSRGGGGGGGGRGDDDHHPDYGWKLRKYRLGIIFGMVSVAMLFCMFTTLFIALRTSGRYDPESSQFVPNWVPAPLPRQLLLWNTLVLLLSSWTMEKARRRARMEAAVVPASHIPGIAPERPATSVWVYATAVLGFAFLALQWTAWTWIHGREIPLAGTAAVSMVYLLTGAHAVHLLAALLVLVYAAIAPRQRRSLDTRRITLEVTSWFWHFMALLWVYIFGLLWYFA